MLFMSDNNVGNLQLTNDEKLEKKYKEVFQRIRVIDENLENIEKSALAYRDNILNFHDEIFNKSDDKDSLQEEIYDLKNTIAKVEKNISIYEEKILNFYKKIYEGLDGDIALVDKFKELQQEIEAEQSNNLSVFKEHEKTILGVQEKYKKLVLEIEDAHKRIFEPTGEDNLSLNQRITSLYQSIDKKNEMFAKVITDIESKQAALTKFKGEMLGVFSADGEIEEKGLQQKLVDLEKSLVSFEEQQKKVTLELKKQIESLLPGATSAGLATSYKDATDEYAEKIKKTTKNFNWGIAALFIVSIVIILWDAFNKPDISTIHGFLVYLSYRLLLISPIVWFTSYNALQSRHLFRLQEEYAHKKAMAESFEGFKRQVEAIDSLNEESNMLKELLGSTISAISFKASDVLDKQHKDTVSMYEKIMDKLPDLKPQKED